MTDQDRPQIYLLTPAHFDAETFAETLAPVLDAAAIACLRLRFASDDDSEVARAADAVRALAHARDIPLVIDRHLALVERLGLDGVHLTDGSKSVRKCREALGTDPIVGTWCGTSRHDGMTAGEAGADYVSFGPVGDTALGAGDKVDPEVFTWWSEVIELPIVAEGALTPDLVRAFTPITDFFAFGDEIWRAEDPAAALKDLDAAIG